MYWKFMKYENSVSRQICNNIQSITLLHRGMTLEYVAPITWLCIVPHREYLQHSHKITCLLFPHSTWCNITESITFIIYYPTIHHRDHPDQNKHFYNSTLGLNQPQNILPERPVMAEMEYNFPRDTFVISILSWPIFVCYTYLSLRV